MKFFCEYCGSIINTDEDDKCPHCGAAYNKNKTYLKLNEEKNKEQQMNNEFKQEVMNHTLKAFKFSRWFVLIPIVMFVVVLSIIIFGIISANKAFNKENGGVKSLFNSVTNQINEQLQEDLKEEKEPENVTVGFDEFGTVEKYKAKVTKYEVVEDKFDKVEEGYELVKFHLVVENLSDEEIRKEDVNCIVDGIAQNNDFSSGYSDLPFFIQKDLTVKGTATFEVPKSAESYDIKYGDYITIHIEK